MTYDTRLGKYGGKPRPVGPRSTLCISSQVFALKPPFLKLMYLNMAKNFVFVVRFGCKMGCKFCATGTMDFKNNLTSGEIVEQLVHASRFSNIRNIVFMGMGEPLNNYTILVEAICVMSGSPFQLSPKRITVSTVIPPVMVDIYNNSVLSLLCSGIFFVRAIPLNWQYLFQLPVSGYSLLVHFTMSEIYLEKLPTDALRTTGSRVHCQYLKLIGLDNYVILVVNKLKVGIIHAINKLHSDLRGLNLAGSLHAPVQEIHCQIMPSARAFPLEKLMTALQAYQKSSQQKIFIEYIMLDGVNDEEQHAHQLGKLLETFRVKILRGTYNIRTTVRKQMGQDISGACGQLVVNLPDKGPHENTALLTDIEDFRI
ncbi:hypothetical protein REPUB_Repub04eG0084200 [Reevesia pubescens]